MEESLENSSGKYFDKKCFGLIQIFRNFWSPFITRLNPDGIGPFAWAGMCLHEALQTPRSPGWGLGGNVGFGHGQPGVSKMSPSEPGGQVCTHGTCLQSPTSLPKAERGFRYCEHDPGKGMGKAA